MMMKGQLLSQSGFTHLESGQHGMPTACVACIFSIVIAATVDATIFAAIARSAAIVLTGAVSIPRRTQSDIRRLIKYNSFIALMTDIVQC